MLGFVALQESLHAVFFQLSEVAYHAHSVTFTVTPNQVVQVTAGHVFALKTESDSVLREFLATSFDVAVLAPRKTS
jgi:hypothetical protein